MRNIIKQNQYKQNDVCDSMKLAPKKKHRLSQQGRKQLTMLCLVAALMGAVYLNWRIETVKAQSLPITETLAEDTSLLEILSPKNEAASASADNEEQKHYGDTLFVSSDDPSSAASYFAEARLDRTQKRDEALDALEQALRQATLTQSEKERLTAELSAFAGAITTESRIENQILAKGFRDCVVFIGTGSIKVVVQADAEGLNAAQAAQIKEAVLAETDFGAENITIVEIN